LLSSFLKVPICELNGDVKLPLVNKIYTPFDCNVAVDEFLLPSNVG
jgi:hypothetical protein